MRIQECAHESPDAFLYPAALNIPGFLHTMYNALEEAISASPGYLHFMNIMRAISSFCNTRAIVNRFSRLCLKKDDVDAKLFVSTAKVHIEWRWEFLDEAIDANLPRFRSIRKHLDLQVMLGKDDGSKLDNQTISKIAEAVRDENFEASAIIYRIFGKVVRRTAQLLEICDCHKELWERRMTRRQIQARLKELLGTDHCVWQGRRLPWFIAVGFEELLEEIRSASCDELQELLTVSHPEDVARYVALMDSLSGP